MTPTPTPISAVTTVPITALFRKISSMEKTIRIYGEGMVNLSVPPQQQGICKSVRVILA
jgi:hypothetical protein